MRTFVILLLVSGCAAHTEQTLPRPTPVLVANPTPPVVVKHPAPPTLRLPVGVTPLSYEISATVVPTEEHLTSAVRIRVRFDDATDLVWLNATELQFGAAHVEWGGENVTATAKHHGDHFVGLALAHAVGPGEGTIVIESTAVISRREAEGVFATTEAGDTYVYTQFEALGARRAWPCFDEPNFKVPWQLTVTAPANLRVFSNTTPTKETVDGAMQTVRFGQTPPMPSYLVAFAVGPFDVVPVGVAGQLKVPVRIVTPKGRGARAKWAAETTSEAIAQLEAYFGTPLPFEKVDLLAISAPTFSGAMEHPGLITYAETLLLAEPSEDTIERRRGELSTTVHELAHQWVGNWVTMAWWDDTWLNESFAEWMESRILQRWKPEWGGALDRVSNQDDAMHTDSLASARRMRQPIESHDDIRNVFDGITYAKGEAVLSMFEVWLGPDVFQKGLRLYLQRHAWGNATLSDFLSAMSEVAGRDVSAPFSSFIDQSGVPLITATLACAPQGPVRVELSQRRFVPEGSTATEQTWAVPVCVRWSGGQQCTLLTTPAATVELNTQTCPTWLLPNAGMTGFYRSRPLAPALLENKELTAAEKLGVHADLTALVRVGELSVRDEISSVPFAVASGDRRLIERAAATALTLHTLLPTTSRGKLAAWVQKHFGSRARALAFTEKPNETEEQQLLRPELVSLVGTVGEDATLRAQSTKVLRAWLRSHDSAPPELVGTALELAAWSNDAKVFDALLKAVKNEPDRRARGHLFAALGGFRDATLAKRARDVVLDPTVDGRESLTILAEQAGQLETSDAAYAFLKEHYDDLVKRLPSDWEATLVGLGTPACTSARLTDVEAFFHDRTPRAMGGPRLYQNAIEGMKQCVAWRARQVPTAVKFFAEGK